MLDQQDKQFIQEAIGSALKQTESNIIETVGTMIEQNILPQFDAIDSRFNAIDARFVSIEAKMVTLVTKDYLDEKLADLRGDLVVLMRKEDTKLKELVGVLREKNILSDLEVKRILSLEPFSQLTI